jgi:hypothetical protein
LMGIAVGFGFGTDPTQLAFAQRLNISQENDGHAMTSGIKGTVNFIGADCPPTAEKKVPPCSGPYPDYEVKVYSEDGKNIIKTAKTHQDGNYFVPLSPGNYVIYTEAGPLESQKEAKKVIVMDNRITQHDLQIDTGIR